MRERNDQFMRERNEMDNTVTTASATTAPSEFERCGSEVERRRQSVAELEGALVKADSFAAEMSRKVDDGENYLIAGQIELHHLTTLRRLHSDAVAKTVTLPAELRTERRLLAKALSVMEGLKERAEQERRQRVKSDIAHVAAPLLDALVTALNSASTLEGFHSQFNLWAAWEYENRCTTSRFGYKFLANVFRPVISGDGAFVVDLINDLRDVAPDLVSPLMEGFIDDCNRRANERFHIQQKEAAQAAATTAAQAPGWRQSYSP